MDIGITYDGMTVLIVDTSQVTDTRQSSPRIA